MADDSIEPIDALIERLEDAATKLHDSAVDRGRKGHVSDYERLRSKAEGVRLALSYAREYQE